MLDSPTGPSVVTIVGSDAAEEVEVEDLSYLESTRGKQGRWQPIKPWLERIQDFSHIRFTLFGGLSAFLIYLSFYGLRVPFKQLYSEGERWSLYQNTTQQSANLVFHQAGYMLGKIYAISHNAEAKKRNVAIELMMIYAVTTVALAVFAFLPPSAKPFALIFQGFPLALVWGLLVTYLEGRNTSDVLLICLCLSFVVGNGIFSRLSSGLQREIEFSNTALMPVLMSLLISPIFLLGTFGLYQLPPPSVTEIESRTRRAAMNSYDRQYFFWKMWPGLVLLWSAYLFLTAFRDFRSNNFNNLDVGNDEQFSMELTVALVIAVPLAMVGLMKDNTLSTRLIFLLMIFGSLLVLAAIVPSSGDPPVMLTGVGNYLAFVLYNSLLFERLISYTGSVSTLAFPMAISDCLGYLASFAASLWSIFGQQSNESKDSITDTFTRLALAQGIFCSIAHTLAITYFSLVYSKDKTKGRSRTRSRTPRRKETTEMRHGKIQRNSRIGDRYGIKAGL